MVGVWWLFGGCAKGVYSESVVCLKGEGHVRTIQVRRGQGRKGHFRKGNFRKGNFRKGQGGAGEVHRASLVLY